MTEAVSSLSGQSGKVKYTYRIMPNAQIPISDSLSFAPFIPTETLDGKLIVPDETFEEALLAIRDMKIKIYPDLRELLKDLLERTRISDHVVYGLENNVILARTKQGVFHLGSTYVARVTQVG